MGTINGTTDIKTIFSFSPGTGKHSLVMYSAALDVPVTELIHILNFFTIKIAFQHPQKRKNSDENQTHQCFLF